jgi:hypothetical protein
MGWRRLSKAKYVIAYRAVRETIVPVSEHHARDVLALSPKHWKKPAEELDAPTSVAVGG